MVIWLSKLTVAKEITPSGSPVLRDADRLGNDRYQPLECYTQKWEMSKA